MVKNKIVPEISLAVSVLATLACVLLIPRVNVNSDMTRYLPDNSPMKRGIDIIESEFGRSASSALPDIRIMMTYPDGMEEETSAVADSLACFDGVNSVNVKKGDGHILFELSVDKSVHQKKLAGKIKNTFPYETVTQTSQDGNTPAPEALVLAVLCLAVILAIMSKSFLEPVLFLVSTGMAIAVNMGTNAFLSSVSITTNSILAVLQLALSMDYSIILMNRFRQQMETDSDKYRAMASACKKAAPAIISSSITTVVGLLMLAFMNLKIGADLGFVLAKGVISSLLFTYTALPGLILIFYDGIKASEKKVPVPKADSLASFCEKFRVPLTVVFIILFGLSYYLSTRTPIRFSVSTPSAIDKVFPKKNAVVLLYDNEKEGSVVPLLDSLERDPNVESVFSYPTLMKRRLSADRMAGRLRELAEAADLGGQAEILTPELMRICYFARYGDKNLRIGFADLADYVKTLSGNPLLERTGVTDLDEKLKMLETLRGMAVNTAAPETGEPGIIVSDTVSVEVPAIAETPAVPEENPHPEPGDTIRRSLPARMSVCEYMEHLHRQQNSAATGKLLCYSDAGILVTKMDANRMTSFMGSTPLQTRMVYSLRKGTKSEMTPLEFAHFLTDDLFKRKALSGMVDKEQRTQMQLIVSIMDAAVSGTLYSRDELDSMVLGVGLAAALRDEDAVEEPVAEPVFPRQAEPAGIPVVSEEPDKPEATAAVHQTEEDPRMILLAEMLEPGRRYDAGSMARNFRALGEDVDESTLNILYMLYGSENHYDTEWKMDLEEVVEFIDSSVMGNKSLESYLGDDVKERMEKMKEGLKEASGLRGPEHSIAAIITGYPEESPQTEAFVRSLEGDHLLIGESVMLCEMKDGFSRELRVVTILTILAILLIVAVTFRSVLTAAILVMSVMSSVFVNVAACGIGGGSDLYLAYLIVQSILMGATIDYGILFTTYYREHRDLREAYRDSIHTILTSGLIICCVPGAMALLLDDAMIRPIVQNLAVGAFAAVAIILLIMPGVLSFAYRKRI